VSPSNHDCPRFDKLSASGNAGEDLAELM
jgi:hypothetical protein